MHLTHGCSFAILALYLMSVFTCRHASRRGLASHFCLPRLPCRCTLRLGSCFCLCVGICLAIADDVQVLALCVCLKGILVEDARGIYRFLSLRRELSWELALHPRLRKGIPCKDPDSLSMQSCRRVGGSVEKLVSRLSRPVSSHARHVDTPIAYEVLGNRMHNVGTRYCCFKG
jgi:hypothetical protein